MGACWVRVAPPSSRPSGAERACPGRDPGAGVRRGLPFNKIPHPEEAATAAVSEGPALAKAGDAPPPRVSPAEAGTHRPNAAASTLAEEAADLAAIGQALGAGRNVNLWSCRTAAGPVGAAFVAGLARASGADIAAATGLVGAAAPGGGWELAAHVQLGAVQPPLTAAGVAGYDRQRPSLGVRQ